jgi:hypothetical protein
VTGRYIDWLDIFACPQDRTDDTVWLLFIHQLGPITHLWPNFTLDAVQPGLGDANGG